MLSLLNSERGGSAVGILRFVGVHRPDCWHGAVPSNTGMPVVSQADVGDRTATLSILIVMLILKLRLSVVRAYRALFLLPCARLPLRLDAEILYLEISPLQVTADICECLFTIAIFHCIESSFFHANPELPCQALFCVADVRTMLVAQRARLNG